MQFPLAIWGKAVYNPVYYNSKEVFPLESNEVFASMDLSPLYGQVRDVYHIEESYFRNLNVKRGLRNFDGTAVIAGITKIGSVQGYGMEDGIRIPIPGKLYYRGISVEDIVETHQKNNTFGFEEVSYLLLMGQLPNAEQLSLYESILAKVRPLPRGFFEDIIFRCPSPDIMNMLGRSVLSLYAYDENPDDTRPENMLRKYIEHIARFPSIVANAYMVRRHMYDGKSMYIHNPKEQLTLSENFLRLVRKDKSYTDDEAKLLDLLLILHAEHGGGNNSAFVCRALSSSGTDTYSAIAGAVGSLKGPLHGGANRKVTEMFQEIRANVRDVEDSDEVRAYLTKILNKEAWDHGGKIYGLGHAVYTLSDPRAMLLKKFARQMAESKGRMEDFRLLEQIEEQGIDLIMSTKKHEMPMCANVDLYSGLVYSMLGIPDVLYTPLFACARIAGWCAHRMEEVLTGKKLIRPGYQAAIRPRAYVPIDQR